MQKITLCIKYTVTIALMVFVSACATSNVDTRSLPAVAERGDYAKVTKLLKEGRDVNGTHKNGVSALHEASLKGHLEIVKLLLVNNANINLLHPPTGTPLSSAVLGQHKEIVILLIKSGADVNVTNAQGVTPLWQAAFKGNVEIAKLLLAAGADVNHPSKRGVATGLHAALNATSAGATQEQVFELVKILLEAGANPNVRVTMGKMKLTPLVLALTQISGKHTEEQVYDLVKLLLEYDADRKLTSEVNGTAVTPLEVAQMMGQHRSAQLLMEYPHTHSSISSHGSCISGNCTNGFGTVVWANGDKYVGQFKDGKKTGQGTYTYGKGEWAGDKYVGQFKDNKRDGQGVYYYANGRIVTGLWEEDKTITTYSDSEQQGERPKTSGGTQPELERYSVGKEGLGISLLIPKYWSKRTEGKNLVIEVTDDVSGARITVYFLGYKQSHSFTDPKAVDEFHEALISEAQKAYDLDNSHVSDDGSFKIPNHIVKLSKGFSAKDDLHIYLATVARMKRKMLLTIIASYPIDQSYNLESTYNTIFNSIRLL